MLSLGVNPAALLCDAMTRGAAQIADSSLAVANSSLSNGDRMAMVVGRRTRPAVDDPDSAHTSCATPRLEDVTNSLQKRVRTTRQLMSASSPAIHSNIINNISDTDSEEHDANATSELQQRQGSPDPVKPSPPSRLSVAVGPSSPARAMSTHHDASIEAAPNSDDLTVVAVSTPAIHTAVVQRDDSSNASTAPLSQQSPQSQLPASDPEWPPADFLRSQARVSPPSACGPQIHNDAPAESDASRYNHHQQQHLPLLVEAVIADCPPKHTPSRSISASIHHSDARSIDASPPRLQDDDTSGTSRLSPARMMTDVPELSHTVAPSAPTSATAAQPAGPAPILLARGGGGGGGGSTRNTAARSSNLASSSAAAASTSTTGNDDAAADGDDGDDDEEEEESYDSSDSDPNASSEDEEEAEEEEEEASDAPPSAADTPALPLLTSFTCCKTAKNAARAAQGLAPDPRGRCKLTCPRAVEQRRRKAAARQASGLVNNNNGGGADSSSQQHQQPRRQQLSDSARQQYVPGQFESFSSGPSRPTDFTFGQPAVTSFNSAAPPARAAATPAAGNVQQQQQQQASQPQSTRQAFSPEQMTELIRRVQAVNSTTNDLPANAPFTIEEIAVADIPLDKVPHAALAEVVAPLESILERIALHPECLSNWWLLIAFPKLVLFRHHRGGSRHQHHLVLTYRKRCQLFVNGQFSELWAQAKAARDETIKKRTERQQHKQQPKKKYPVDDVDSRFSLGLSTDVTSIDDLDAEQMRRVVKLAMEGSLSRAVSSLGAAQIAETNDTTLAAMLKLHPQRDAPNVFWTDQQIADSITTIPSVTDKQIKTVLSSFPPSSAAGPSGLSPGLLAAMCRVRSSTIAVKLAAVVTHVMHGLVPLEARKVIYGAKLFALVKKNGGLRPVACGETLRRIAAKLLLAQQKKKIQKIRWCQVAVGFKAGADVKVQGMRLFARLAKLEQQIRPAASQQQRAAADESVDDPFSSALTASSPTASAAQQTTTTTTTSSSSNTPAPTSDDDLVSLEVDFRNAFNCVSRNAILDMVAKLLPEMLPYTVAALAEPSSLFFGNHRIPSTAGAQQGDPASMLFFALVLHAIETDPRVAPLLQKMMLAPSYADDASYVGRARHVAELYPALVTVAKEHGLDLEPTKSLLASAGGTLPPCLANSGLTAVNVDNLVALGCPVGANAGPLLDKQLEKAFSLMSVLSRLPNKHVALMMMSYCAAGPRVMHLLRALGTDEQQPDFQLAVQLSQSASTTPVPPPSVLNCRWKQFDEEVGRALEAIVGQNLDDFSMEQLRAPPRFGGCNVRFISNHASVAHLVSCRRLAENWRAIAPSADPEHAPPSAQQLADAISTADMCFIQNEGVPDDVLAIINHDASIPIINAENINSVICDSSHPSAFIPILSDAVLKLSRRDQLQMADKNLQHSLSSSIEEAAFNDRVSCLKEIIETDTSTRAVRAKRILAAWLASTAKYLPLRFYGSIYTAAPRLFFSNEELMVLIALQLGLPQFHLPEPTPLVITASPSPSSPTPAATAAASTPQSSGQQQQQPAPPAAATTTAAAAAAAGPILTASSPAQRALPPLLSGGSPQLLKCCFCGNDSADIMGDHFLTCMNGGFKTLQHSKVLDILAREGYRAHGMPLREPVLFNNNSMRADLSLRLPGEGRDAPLVTDIAVTHFASATTLRAGSVGPNTAAVAYQTQHKDPKYRQHGLVPLLQFRDMQLLPCVFDSLGAPAPDAQAYINRLGRAIAHCTSTHRSVVIRELHHRICFTIAQCSARRIVAGIAAVNDSLDRQLQQQNASHTHTALIGNEDTHSDSRELGGLAGTITITEGEEGMAGGVSGAPASNVGGSL
jgi:hypothetical protein